MAKKKSLGQVYAMPNTKYKRYHKLYVKSSVVTEHGVHNRVKNPFIYVIKSTGYIRMPSIQIDACVRMAKRIFRKRGLILPRVYTYLPLTKKPSETRMGKGKSSRISSWVSPVKKGKVIFELQAREIGLINEVFSLVCRRIPMKLSLLKLRM